MKVASTRRRGNISAALRAARTIDHPVDDPVLLKRQLVAGFCRLLVEQSSLSAVAPPANPLPVGNLPRRLRQTLARLLAGDSEKQIAIALELSRHTVHVYVKALYRRFDVCSRGELLARFVHAPGMEAEPLGPNPKSEARNSKQIQTTK